jgi:hypothetical protein
MPGLGLMVRSHRAAAAIIRGCRRLSRFDPPTRQRFAGPNPARYQDGGAARRAASGRTRGGLRARAGALLVTVPRPHHCMKKINMRKIIEIVRMRHRREIWVVVDKGTKMK